MSASPLYEITPEDDTANDQEFRRPDPRAWTMYLFLVTVADAQGLSYYSDGANVVRTVSENCRTLKFKSQSF